MQRRDELLRGGGTQGSGGGDMQHRVNPQMLASISADIENVGGSIKAGMRQFARSVKQSPLTADNMQKIQQVRVTVSCQYDLHLVCSCLGLKG